MTVTSPTGADTREIGRFEDQCDALDRHGFLLVRHALEPDVVRAWRDCLFRKYERQEWDISNEVGNVAFDHLLKQEPELARPMVGHHSVAPYLREMLGRQCQLRSFRAHMNPEAYTQEWHRDFSFYWRSEKEGRHALRPLCMNTTFYLTDNTPETGRLSYLTDYCHKEVPLEVRDHGGLDYYNPFHRWCLQQDRTDLFPLTGDVVIFFSHIPHQGAKLKEDAGAPIRSNVVLHYQQTPMYPGIRFVSSPLPAIDALGYEGTFPFAGDCPVTLLDFGGFPSRRPMLNIELLFQVSD